MKVEFICQYCGRKFSDFPSNKRKFCSTKCRYKGKKDAWTKEEKKLLKKYWNNASEEELKRLLPARSYRALIMMASKLGVKRHCKKPLKKGFDKPTLELAQFLGNITGDGHIGKRTISYTNSSLKAVRQFKKNLKKQFGITKASELHYRTFYRTNASSVLLGEWLHRIFKGNLVARNKIIPEIVWKANKEFKSNYLAFLFGDDSGFIVDRGIPRLTFTSKSRRLAYGVKRMLKEDFGIESRMVESNCYVITITKNSEAALFYNKIGFSAPSRVAKGKRKGEPKQRVLGEWVLPRMNCKCADCGKDITSRQIKCKRCEVCQKEYSKEWRKEYRPKYRAKNIEKVKEWQRKYYLTHKEKEGEKQKRWKEKNIEWVRERARKYYQKNKDKINKRKRERRAKKKLERLQAEGQTKLT